MKSHEGDAFEIRISGRDHVDLLHRVASNEVRGLAVGARNEQCLLSAKGKIIVPFALRRENDHVLISGPLELKRTVLETLDRYIFTEDVLLEPLPDVQRESDNDERIEAGRPKWGVDIDEDTIPWEAGMGEYVSTSKGCYTGQETIARIETYGQVARRLMRLTCAAQQPPAIGEVFREGKPVGRITSITSIPRGGLFRAIGMIRREVAEGENVTGEDGREWTATTESSDAHK